MTILYVDVETCPVTDDAIRTVSQRGIPSFLCTTGVTQPLGYPLVQGVFRTGGRQNIVDWIAGTILSDGICLTNDTKLADRCLKRGAKVLLPNGTLYTGTAVAPPAAPPVPGPASPAASATQPEQIRFMAALNTLLVPAPAAPSAPAPVRPGV